MVTHGHKYIIVTWEGSALTMGWASRTLTPTRGQYTWCFDADTGRLVAWTKGGPHLGSNLRQILSLNRNTHDGPRKDQILQVVKTESSVGVYGCEIDLPALNIGLVMECSSSNNIPDGLIVDNPPTIG